MPDDPAAQVLDVPVVTDPATVLSNVPDGSIKIPDNWKESLPSDLRSDPVLEQIKDVSSLVKGYIHGQKRLGSSIRIPGTDADENEVNEFLGKLGRPESADKYTELETKDLPDGVEVNADFVKSFREAAYKSGLNDKQQVSLLQEVMKSELSAIDQNTGAEEGDLDKIEDGLRAHFGQAYDQNLAVAKKAYDTFVQKDY